MTIMDMVNKGNYAALALMGVIIVGILAMMLFFYRELKKTHGEAEKKNDQPVVSTIRQTGNDAVTAAISAAVNEYRKN
jgi:hypothetical protein